MEQFFPQIQVKTKKKGLHQQWNTFVPRFQVDTCTLRCTPESIYWGGGDADVDHTQTIGGDTAKLLGGIYSPIPPPGFGTSVHKTKHDFSNHQYLGQVPSQCILLIGKYLNAKHVLLYY